MPNQAGAANRPLRVQTVRGEAYDVLGRSLIPVARIVSFGKGRATLRREGVQGWAVGFGQVVPVAVVEKAGNGERHIAITDVTSIVLRWMLAAAVAVTLLFMALRRLASRFRRREGQG